MCKDKPQHPSAFQRQARGTRTPALFRSELMMQCLLGVITSTCGTFPPTLGQPNQIQTVSPTFTHPRWTSSETLTADLSGLSWFVKQVRLCCFSVGICQIYHIKSHWLTFCTEWECWCIFDMSYNIWPLSEALTEERQRKVPEFILLLAVFNESKSWYREVGRADKLKKTPSPTQYHTINGYINSTLPGAIRNGYHDSVKNEIFVTNLSKSDCVIHLNTQCIFNKVSHKNNSHCMSLVNPDSSF